MGVFNTVEPCFHNCNNNDVNASLSSSLSTDLAHIQLHFCCFGLQLPETQGLLFLSRNILGNPLKGMAWTSG